MNDLLVYFQCMRLQLLAAVEYKGWWLRLLNTCVYAVAEFVPVLLLSLRFGSAGVWTAERIMLVYALAILSFGLAEFLFRGFDMFPSKLLRTGELDRLLLRPCRLTTQVACSAFDVHRLARPLTGLALLLICLRRLGVAPGAREAAILLSALCGGTLLYFGVFLLTSGLAFFTVKGLDWITLFTNASYQVTRCPADYIPRSLKGIFTFLLPVLLVSYYPASLVCGWGEPGWTGLLALPAGAAFLGLALLVWRCGLRHYASSGS